MTGRRAASTGTAAQHAATAPARKPSGTLPASCSMVHTMASPAAPAPHPALIEDSRLSSTRSSCARCSSGPASMALARLTATAYSTAPVSTARPAATASTAKLATAATLLGPAGELPQITAADWPAA